MKDIGTETLLMLELFGLGDDENEPSSPKSNIIVNIPHSSTVIPDYKGFRVGIDIINNEVKLLTDHKTDILFLIKNANHIIFPYSRVFCDVERLMDDIEPMFQYGRGFYYTHSDSGLKIRDDFFNHKRYIYETYYIPYHLHLENMVEKSLSKFGNAIIIDAHSFSKTPFESDLIKESNRPDICLGTDSFHTDEKLLNHFNSEFTKRGFKVKINNPYKGTIVPMKYYDFNKNVQSIMIEINRDLYMVYDKPNENSIKMLNDIINNIVLSYEGIKNDSI